MPLQDLDVLLGSLNKKSTTNLKQPHEISQSPGFITNAGSRFAEGSKDALNTGVGLFKQGINEFAQGLQGKQYQSAATGALKGMQGIARGTAGQIIQGGMNAIAPINEGIMKFGEGIGKATNWTLNAITPDAITDPLKKQAIESIKSAAAGGKMIAEHIPEETKNLLKQSGLTALEVLDFLPFIYPHTVGVLAADAAEMAGAGLTKLPKSLGKSLFEKPIKSVDDIIEQADFVYNSKTPSQIRNVAEAEAPSISIKEKWAGVRPNVKKQIEGKYDKLKEYFDIAHARNSDFKAPTVAEFGNQNVVKYRDILQSKLNDTGSEIGNFRNSIAKNIIPSKIAGSEIRNEFINEINKLNLTTNNDGMVIRKPNTIKKVSDSEIKVLNDLYNDIYTLRENPTMENLIDLRNAFDSQINFAKQAKDATKIIDPISRKVRRKIKEINDTAIGPKQAKLLSEYSDLLGILADMNKSINSSSGGEYLLRRALSERGRYSSEIFRALEKHTGIVLLVCYLIQQRKQ